MLSKLLIYIIQIFLLRENYKQKQKRRRVKKSILHEGAMKNMVNKDTCTIFADTMSDFFPLRLQKILASRHSWQQVTSQTIIRFIKGMLKYVLSTFETT